MRFTELTDKQWETMQKHLPKPAVTGRPRCDDRTTVNGIIYVLISGCRWTELPATYGSKSTAHRRFQYMQQEGIWKKITEKESKEAVASDGERDNNKEEMHGTPGLIFAYAPPDATVRQGTLGREVRWGHVHY